MKAIPYTLKLKEKVLIGDPAEENPNLAGGFDHIPGSVLRGALIEVLNKTKQPILSKDELYQIFFSGNVAFLNAYPSTADQKRSLPIPLAFQTAKDDSGKVVFNLAMEYPQDVQLKNLSCKYCWINFSDSAYITCSGYQPLRTIRLHNMRPPDTNYDSDEAQLFTYDSLAAGQVFRGWIISEDTNLLKRVAEAASPRKVLSLYIGKSRNAEYGKISLEFDQIVDDWQEVESEEIDEGNLIVTLLSDCIIRDPATGAFTEDLLPVVGKDHKKAFIQMKIVGGYNRTWNMPIPQSRAIAAGSVFVYDSDSDLYKKLKKACVIGVGERTLDGFGRIALNYCRQSEYFFSQGIVEKEREHSLEKENTSLSQTNAEELRAIAERIYLRRARSKITFLMQQVSCQRMPSNTQLARLAAVLERQHSLLQEELVHNGAQNFNELKAFLDGLTKNTREYYQKARVEGKPFDIWLRQLIEDPSPFSLILSVTLDAFLDVGFDAARYERMLLVEYVSAFLDQVRKKRKQESRGNQEVYNERS